MPYILIQFLINLILLWHNIDGTVINCTVLSVILQEIPNRIVGTIGIANKSNEEIYWNHIHFETGVQFPLTFSIVINNYEIIPDTYILQLHIYELPRDIYDLPLWSADTRAFLQRSDKSNLITFSAHSDRKPIGPCMMGVIVNIEHEYINLKDAKLLVKVGTMPSLTFNIQYLSFPILFMIADIPIPQIENSTLITILLTKPSSIIAYEARKKDIININNECTTILFKVSEERSMNLTVTMTAHVFTLYSPVNLGTTYRIYEKSFLIFEKTEFINDLKFPFVTSKTLVPITTPANYTIEATIFGSTPRFSSGETLFEGVTYTRLVPGTNNNVRISMIYTGTKIGTTVIGTLRPTPSNQSTWPLVGANLAFVIADQTNNFAESYQSIIYDQTFPIQFTLLAIKSINQSYQNVVFTVTITSLDSTVLWAATTEKNNIIFEQLNRLDINMSIADGYKCLRPGQGWCSSLLSNDINKICCSQFKCSGDCKLP